MRMDEEREKKENRKRGKTAQRGDSGEEGGGRICEAQRRGAASPSFPLRLERGRARSRTSRRKSQSRYIGNANLLSAQLQIKRFSSHAKPGNKPWTINERESGENSCTSVARLNFEANAMRQRGAREIRSAIAKTINGECNGERPIDLSSGETRTV